MPWSWSPVRARVRNRNVSTIPATVTSDWPTPTVSTSTTSYPAASSTVIACDGGPGDAAEGAGGRRGPDVGVAGRRPAAPSGSCRRAPSRRCATDDGSTASTPTRWPAAVRLPPSASMNVDLPTPGTPEMPTRVATGGVRARPARRAAHAPRSRWSGRERLHQRDRPARPRRGAGRGRPRPAGTSTVRRPSVAVSCVRRQLGRAGRARTSAITVPGRNTAAAPISLQRGHVVGRDHAADDDHDVGAALLGQRLLQRRQQREVAGGQRARRRRCARRRRRPAGRPPPAWRTAAPRRRRSPCRRTR